jgi:hypothetical protein
VFGVFSCGLGVGGGYTGEEGGEDEEFHCCGLLVWFGGCLGGFDDVAELRT